VNKIELSINENEGALVGELTLHTIMQVSNKSIKEILVQQFSVIDLQQVTRIDTAGLAWLFYLVEKANSTRCQLTFSNVPAKLNKLISLSGVEGFLPIETQKLQTCD
jgi:phospholipid transport system transporter-binding protein